MSRRSARQNAFKLLFQMDFHESAEHEDIQTVFLAEQEEPVSQKDQTYILTTVEGTKANITEIDAKIDAFAKNWDTKRMNRVDLAILRLAVYEMLFAKEAPVAVVINEAVELAKEFSSDEAPSFINGVLGRIAKAQTE